MSLCPSPDSLAVFKGLSIRKGENRLSDSTCYESTPSPLLEFTPDDRPIPCRGDRLGLMSFQQLFSALPLFVSSSGSLGAVGLSLLSTSTDADNSEARVVMVDAAAEGDNDDTEPS